MSSERRGGEAREERRHAAAEPEAEPRVEDLDVPEDDAANVQGGVYNWWKKTEG